MTKAQRAGIAVAVAAALAVTILLKERRSEAEAPAGEVRAGERPSQVAPSGAAEANLPRLVDLGSNTCIPCKMMAPILEELTTAYAGRFAVQVIDVRQEREAAQGYGIRVIPTQIFFDAGGRELFRHEGFMSKEAILEKWTELGVDVAAGG